MIARWFLPPLVVACFALALPLAARSSADRPIVIGWQADAGRADVDAGIQMGLRETKQTAGLLGRDVRIAPRPPRPFATIAADASEVTIAGGPRCTFRMLPTAEERAARLARWKASSGRTGDFRVAAWDPSLVRYGAGDVNQRYTRAFHQPMTEGAWAGWAAMKAAVEAALRSESPDGCAALANIRFDAHKGAMLSFVHRELQQPLYVVEHTPAGDRVVAELPPS